VSEQESPEKLSVEQALNQVSSRREGLTTGEAQERLQQYGYNRLEEKQTSALRKFLGYFWGPIPWMIEVAAILSAVVQHWADLGIIVVLLVFNAGVEFYQEYQAGNAIEQLKRHLALKARVLRDGKWSRQEAAELVPGDIVRLRLGDVIPADIRLIEGDYLSVDQSALTGESLPVERQTGDIIYSGSAAKQGEMVGVVHATGMHTYFGRTAQLVGSAKTVSHFQKAVLTIGDYLIYITLGLVGVLILVQLHRNQPLLEVAQFALILTVAAIPVAMPAVLSVTMAIGAVVLSKMQAIVSRLESIEEMAGIDILCSDKTGTLTQNRLTLGDPYTAQGVDDTELILAAALASKEEDADAIDLAILDALPDRDQLGSFTQQEFVPFDPVSKRTEASINDAKQRTFHVTKGAPQVILKMCRQEEQAAAEISDKVDDYAAKGYRTLGVARSEDGDQWTFMGLLPLYDPPREDARETIDEAERHGVHVKMVTGDNTSIAREISSQLGLGRNIVAADKLLHSTGEDGAQGDGDQIEKADGFAQVFPEHKYNIVKTLQNRGHLVGMTGDGVNDAPALKQADVGVAVSGATDAARAAADLVLTAPGLSVIVKAVEEARRIFERMNSYAIYRITETIRIMIFLVLAMLVYDFYPITAIMIILLALLNDLPIMTIAYDNTWLDPNPVRWQMRRVLTVASVLGGVGVIETFLLLVLAKVWFGLSGGELQSVIFLKLVVAGHLTLFVARSRRPFFAPPYPAPLLLLAILGTQSLAAMIVGFGWFVTAIPWSYIGYIWLYCLVWILIEDMAKLLVSRHMEFGTGRHQRFIDMLRNPLFEHGHGSRRDK
jgi:H+-transporting ATPase